MNLWGAHLIQTTTHKKCDLSALFLRILRWVKGTKSFYSKYESLWVKDNHNEREIPVFFFFFFDCLTSLQEFTKGNIFLLTDPFPFPTCWWNFKLSLSCLLFTLEFTSKASVQRHFSYNWSAHGVLSGIILSLTCHLLNLTVHYWNTI